MFYDRCRQLLGARRSPAETCRLAGRLADVAAYLLARRIELEDIQFYQHVGIGVYALVRVGLKPLTPGMLSPEHHGYSGFHLSVCEDRTRERSPCCSLMLTPPLAEGEGE